MDEELKSNAYVGLRIIEVLCIAVFVFGFLWEGTEILKLSLPQFMMLYGGMGAVISEMFSRFINKKLKKNEIIRKK